MNFYKGLCRRFGLSGVISIALVSYSDLYDKNSRSALFVYEYI